MMRAMGSRRLACVLLPLLGACSILYNPDNLPDRDAAVIDAPPPPPIDAPTDADPSQLTLTGFETSAGGAIPEGTGAGGGRPALVILTGSSLVGSAVVTAAFLDEPDAGAEGPTVDGFDAFTDSTGAAVAVRIPVLPDLAAGSQRMMRLTVTQGSASGSVDIPIDGLDELTITGATSPMVDPTPDLYSRIEIAGNLHYTPGQADPVILRATADVVVTAVLDVDASGTTAGPHGCDGGLKNTAGTCSPGGAMPGAMTTLLTVGSGGGGGGFGAMGVTGTGQSGGVGGLPTGNDMLVPIRTAAGVAGNRGNGGGGGGTGTLLGSGGPGGGGGGTIVIDAGGDVTVSGAGALRSRGGAGAGNGGGGGGGSGGAIFVRAGGGVTAPGAWLSAPGGARGGTNNPGGTGAVGRIRVDSSRGDNEAIAAMATTPAATRGPAWDDSAPVVTATSPLTVVLRGEAGRQHGVRLNDAALTDASIGVSGTTSVQVPLTRGRNVLCATWSSNAASTHLDRAEARACIDIAYVGP